MVIKYSDVFLWVSRPDVSGQYFIAPASNITLSTERALVENRILASNQNDGITTNGPVSIKVAVEFPLCSKFESDNPLLDSYNLLSGLMTYYTGASGMSMRFNDTLLSGTYLDKISVSIQPFAPIMASAEFTCTDFNSNYGDPFVSSSPVILDSLTNYLGFGNNVQISGGDYLSEKNYQNIDFAITCARTYQTTIGSTQISDIFLDSVVKELSIKDTNIYSFLNYESSGDVISINPKTQSGQLFLPSGVIGMSASSKIQAQNITASAGDVVSANISLKEIVL